MILKTYQIGLIIGVSIVALALAIIAIFKYFGKDKASEDTKLHSNNPGPFTAKDLLVAAMNNRLFIDPLALELGAQSIYKLALPRPQLFPKKVIEKGGEDRFEIGFVNN